MMKTLKKLFLLLIALVVLIGIATLTPIDNTPYQQMPYYQTTKATLNNALATLSTDTSTINIGWAKINFTPNSPKPTAGYGDRHGAAYKTVHDSVFVRAIVLQNHSQKVAMISADLLIIPPAVTAKLKTLLPTIGFRYEDVYLAATHTHNSLGAWGEGLIGESFAGEYEADMVDYLAQKIVNAIEQATKQVAPVEVGYGQMYIADMVRNRLVGDKGTIEPFVRVLKLKKQSGETALLCTYSAHPTTLDDDKIMLSRDYPGMLVDSLEHKSAQFAMFMAGAVGSMAPLDEAKDDFEQMQNEAAGLQIEIEKNLFRIVPTPAHKLRMLTANIGLREPHYRINQSLRIRPWVFKKTFGEYPADVKALAIGNTLLIGLPCDYSGEFMNDLTAYAEKKGKHLIVTSFNGGYIGYVTPDAYYNVASYETQTMNWFGPQNGAYFQEIVKTLIDKM
jgi:neutral ceramidase